MKSSITTKAKRFVYLDVLKIIAMFFVVSYHAGGGGTSF